MGNVDSSGDQARKQWFAVGQYRVDGIDGPSVQEEDMGQHRFIRAHLSEDERYGVVEIAFYKGQLQIRAPEGILEFTPNGGLLTVQVRDAFGNVHGPNPYVGGIGHG